MINEFLALSSELACFTVFELLGTGQAAAYLATTEKVVGAALLQELLTSYAKLKDTPLPARSTRICQEIMGNEKLGPIARNIIKLWYAGVWYELPIAWTDKYGALENNVSFTVSPASYTEGLLWTAIGANPSGAKAPGYGSWAQPPQIPAF